MCHKTIKPKKVKIEIKEYDNQETEIMVTRQFSYLKSTINIVLLLETDDV